MPSIIPTSTEQASEIARRLLDAADSPGEVITDTSGRTVAFTVSDELAAKAGFGGPPADDEETETETETESESATTTVADEPPRDGAGSGLKAWREFLDVKGFAYDDSDKRDELITKWDLATTAAGAAPKVA
jgi:hypothetical protein